MEYEAYVVEVGYRSGKRYANRLILHVPLDVATGRLERVSDLQLRELERDLKAERKRRLGLAGWNPSNAVKGR